MAEMALGYGSEYQLLRYLGHHRDYLNKEISSALNTNENISWMDYPQNSERISLDGEWKDVECFRSKELSDNWKNYWPSRGNTQNWDGIFKIKDVWYFVEAKAHITELETPPCGATADKNIQTIKKAFEETISLCKSTKDADYWISKDCKSYQPANRLAFINFCKRNGIKAKVVYLFFLNGYDKPGTGGKLSVKRQAEWQEALRKEYLDLGISEENLRNLLHIVYIDCTKCRIT